jgi:hypothetical protein
VGFFVSIIGVLLLVLFIASEISIDTKLANMSPEDRAEYQQEQQRRSRKASALLNHGSIKSQRHEVDFAPSEPDGSGRVSALQEE